MTRYITLLMTATVSISLAIDSLAPPAMSPYGPKSCQQLFSENGERFGNDASHPNQPRLTPSNNRISTTVFEAFQEVVPGITQLELAKLSKGPQLPLPENILSVFEMRHELEITADRNGRTFLPASTIDDLTTIYNMIRKMKSPNTSSSIARLSEDEIESLTLFIGENIFYSAKPKIVYDPYENTDRDRQAHRKKWEPQDDFDHSIQNDLISIVAHDINEEPTPEQRVLVEGVVRTMIDVNRRRPLSILPRFSIPDPYKRRRTLSRLEVQRILKWIGTGLFEFLEERYPGSEGQKEFASEYKKGSLFYSWMFTRPYISYERLKEIGWESSRWGITNDQLDNVEALINANWLEFYSKYQRIEGLQRLADEYFSGELADAYYVVNRLTPDDKRYYMNEISGRVLLATRDKNGVILPRYWGNNGKSRFLDDEAEIRVHRHNPNLSANKLKWTFEQKEAFRKTRENIRHVADRILIRNDHKALSFDEMLANYSGTAGMMEFARERDLSAKNVRKWVDAQLGSGTAKALGWKTTFLSVAKFDHLRNLVIDEKGEVKSKFQGHSGFYRFMSDNYSFDSEGADTDSRVLFTEDQLKKLQWKEKRLTFENWRAFQLATPLTIENNSQLHHAYTQSQWVKKRILNANGTPKAVFQGTSGKAHYAALFHRGLPSEAEGVTRFCLSAEDYKALGWVQSDGLDYKVVIKQGLRERWVPVSTAEGVVDINYQGELGFLNYLYYRRLPAKESLDELRGLISNEEFAALQWDTIASRVEETKTRSLAPWKTWSEDARSAAFQYLAFCLKTGRAPEQDDWGEVPGQLILNRDRFFGLGEFKSGKVLEDKAYFESKTEAKRAVHDIALYFGLLITP